MEKREHVYSHKYGNGLKLMEHSWINNGFVKAVEALIAKGGAWYGDHIVWAGDYAPKEKNSKNNLYFLCKKEVQPTAVKKSHRFVINLDKKEFVDTTKIPISDIWTDSKDKEWPFIMHPLPILTCEGNGQGGGDFHKGHPLVGTWARSRVTVSNRKPGKEFKEIEFYVFEGTTPKYLTPKKEKVHV